jgi:serine/threonine protein kinase/broad specificity phosphatase PhoE
MMKLVGLNTPVKASSLRGTVRRITNDELVRGNKRFERGDESSDGSAKMSSRDALLHEMFLIKSMCHDNIVRFVDCLESEHAMWLVSELCSVGSLHHVLARFGRMPEPLVASYVGQVLDALAYLHGRSVVHADVKASNCLVTSDGVVKLTDFGLSCATTPTTTADGDDAAPATHDIDNLRGSPFFMPPEALDMAPPSPAGDIWSLAMFALQLFSGRPPYARYSKRATVLFHLMHDASVSIPSSVSPPFRAFLDRCLAREPELRAAAADLLSDAWLATRDHRRSDDATPQCNQLPVAVDADVIAANVAPLAVARPLLTSTASAASVMLNRGRRATQSALSVRSLLTRSGERSRSRSGARARSRSPSRKSLKRSPSARRQVRRSRRQIDHGESAALVLVLLGSGERDHAAALAAAAAAEWFSVPPRATLALCLGSCKVMMSARVPISEAELLSLHLRQADVPGSAVYRRTAGTMLENMAGARLFMIQRRLLGGGRATLRCFGVRDQCERIRTLAERVFAADSPRIAVTPVDAAPSLSLVDLARERMLLASIDKRLALNARHDGFAERRCVPSCSAVYFVHCGEASSQQVVDAPLSHVGTQQADAVASFFESRGGGAVRIVCSPLRRARLTAERIASASALVHVDYDDRLRARRSLPCDMLAGADGDDQIESIDTFQARARQFAADFLAADDEGGAGGNRTLIAVTHSTVISELTSHSSAAGEATEFLGFVNGSNGRWLVDSVHVPPNSIADGERRLAMREYVTPPADEASLLCTLWPRRFHSNGAMRRCYGHSVLCRIDEPRLAKALRLLADSWLDGIAVLPLLSLHVPVFDAMPLLDSEAAWRSAGEQRVAKLRALLDSFAFVVLNFTVAAIASPPRHAEWALELEPVGASRNALLALRRRTADALQLPASDADIERPVRIRLAHQLAALNATDGSAAAELARVRWDLEHILLKRLGSIEVSVPQLCAFVDCGEYVPLCGGDGVNTLLFGVRDDNSSAAFVHASAADRRRYSLVSAGSWSERWQSIAPLSRARQFAALERSSGRCALYSALSPYTWRCTGAVLLPDDATSLVPLANDLALVRSSSSPSWQLYRLSSSTARAIELTLPDGDDATLFDGELEPHTWQGDKDMHVFSFDARSGRISLWRIELLSGDSDGGAALTLLCSQPSARSWTHWCTLRASPDVLMLVGYKSSMGVLSLWSCANGTLQSLGALSDISRRWTHMTAIGSSEPPAVLLYASKTGTAAVCAVDEQLSFQSTVRWQLPSGLIHLLAL